MTCVPDCVTLNAIMLCSTLYNVAFLVLRSDPLELVLGNSARPRKGVNKDLSPTHKHYPCVLCFSTLLVRQKY